MSNRDVMVNIPEDKVELHIVARNHIIRILGAENLPEQVDTVLANLQAGDRNTLRRFLTEDGKAIDVSEVVTFAKFHQR